MDRIKLWIAKAIMLIYSFIGLIPTTCEVDTSPLPTTTDKDVNLWDWAPQTPRVPNVFTGCISYTLCNENTGCEAEAAQPAQPA